MNTVLLWIDLVPTYLCLTLKNSNVCSVNFLNNMRYRQQKRKSQGLRLKMCCKFYIILEIQSFHLSLIRYHNSSMKIAIINKNTGKFCTCESIQWKLSESIQWMRIDLIGSRRESIWIDSNRINMPALCYTRENFEKMVWFSAFWYIFWSDFVLKKYQHFM